MSTALYRRYRPESFADVIGQEHVTEPLMTALEKNRVNHAYLFSGPRGCGKTTSARILARCLNCAEGPTPTPCGTCESCRDLARDGGGSLDVIEMDAASHGGVDHARDLRERASFAPVRDRYKIFIIDEAHMVTREGFNALLKIVEEPPAHIKFIFATTEPNKVLGTIRSRTHHYPFRLVPPETLHNYLSQLCKEEGVKVQPGVLQLVVRAGGGSVRDSLSILDQLMAGASGEQGITYDLAVALLGFTHGELLDGMVNALAAADASAVFAAVHTAVQSGQDPRRFVEDLLERFRDLLMLQAVPDASQSVLRDLPEAQLRSLRSQAEQLTTAEVTRAAEITSTALNEMSGATSPQLTLELMCAQIMLATAEGNTATLGARLDTIEKRLDAGDFTAPARQVSAPRQAETSQVKTQVEQTRQAEQPQNTQVSQAPVAPANPGPTQPPAPLTSAPLAGLRRPASDAVPSAPEASPAVPAPHPAPAQPAIPPVSRNVVELAKTNWHDVIAQVSSPTARHWLEQCTPSKYEDGQLYIRATMDVLKMVKPHIEELAHALYRVLELQVRVRGEVEKRGSAPGSQAQPAPVAPSQPAAATPAPPAQPAPEAQRIPEAPAPAAGPRAGEQAWAQHGQPRTNTAPQWSTDDWNNPVTSWDVAPIPNDDAPTEDTYSDRQPAAQYAPSAPETPVETEAPAAHSLSEQVEGQAPKLNPTTAPQDSAEARQDSSESGQEPNNTPTYDGPLEEPDDPYEDREYIAGVGYADPTPAAPSTPAPEAESQGAASSTTQPVTEPAPEAEIAAEMQNPGRKLSFRERHAAQIAAGARSAQAQRQEENDTEPEEFVPSDEDTALEETVLIGQRAVEKILGGIVIDEQPLHGN